MNRADFENDKQWWEYRDYMLRNFGKFWSENEQKFVNASSLDICYEICPECEYEVPLENAKLKTPHKCPRCGKYIMPCNLCDYCDNSCNWKKLNRETGKIENMKIQDLELRIFRDLDTLKQYIKDNFKVDEEEGVVEIEHDCYDFELDDELAFCDGEYDYSVYYMKGASGRVIVVETNRQRY